MLNLQLESIEMLRRANNCNHIGIEKVLQKLTFKRRPDCCIYCTNERNF